MYDKIKNLRDQARKEQNLVALSIYSVVLGDFDRIIANEGELCLDAAVKVIEKIIKGNNEILNHKKDETLVAENNLLSTLLPKKMTIDEIESALDNKEILESGNIGLAIKVSMSRFKGHYVDKQKVVDIVRNIYADKDNYV